MPTAPRTAPRRRGGRLPAVLVLLAGLVVVLLLAGCGGSSASGGAGADPTVRVALDFTPNPNHAPLLLAVHDGYDRREHVHLRIQVPGSGPNSLQLLLAGKVQIGVLDIDDLALAVERGAPIVGVGALVQQPLGAIVAQPGIRSPRDLRGRTVGVSGLPSDPAFLRAILSGQGVSLSSLHLVTIGFNAVTDMLAGRIAAVPAFWSDEGVALRERGLAVREFRIDRYGAPEFPEVVLAVTRRTLRQDRPVLLRALAAIALGAERAYADPKQAAAVVTAAEDGADPRLVRAQTLALRPALRPALRLDGSVLERFSAWSARTHLLPRPLDVGRAFALDVPPAALHLAARAAHTGS